MGKSWWSWWSWWPWWPWWPKIRSFGVHSCYTWLLKSRRLVVGKEMVPTHSHLPSMNQNIQPEQRPRKNLLFLPPSCTTKERLPRLAPQSFTCIPSHHLAILLPSYACTTKPRRSAPRMSPKKRKVSNAGLPNRPIPLPPRTYGLPLDATKTRHHELHRREVDAGMKRETEHQIILLEQQQVLRRKEMRKEPAVEGETSLNITEVRFAFECRIRKDRIWMMIVHNSDTDRTIRLDSELGGFSIFACPCFVR